MSSDNNAQPKSAGKNLLRQVFYLTLLFTFLISPPILAQKGSLALQNMQNMPNAERQANDPFDINVSLDLRDMDIVDVLKFLSLKGDFNVVISKNITGRVTLVMKNVSIGDALDIILKANNLSYTRQNNVVYVMTAEEYLSTYGKKFDDQTEVRIVNLRYAKPSYVLAALDSLKSNLGKIVIDEDTGSVVLIDTKNNLDKMIETLDQMDTRVDTKTYKLQYANAKDIAAQLKVKLDAKSVGSIQADERSNQLIVTALPERLTEVERLIYELDAPTKAVMIEVRILQINLNPKYDAGINWSNPFGQSEDKFVRNLNVAATFPIRSTVTAASTGLASLTYGALNAELIQFQLNALKQVINSRVIARPTLVVTHNQEASIHIGDTIPYVTSTTTGTGDTATVSEEINFIDVGIKLNVTPVINDDGYITMKVRPEISSQTATITTPQGANIPQVNTTFVETTALVRDGHTVIIGGLKQITNANTRKGLPYLMDIPVAGGLFKSEVKSLLDTEIVIMLTPYVLDKDHDTMEDRLEIQPDKGYDVELKQKEEEAAKKWINEELS